MNKLIILSVFILGGCGVYASTTEQMTNNSIACVEEIQIEKSIPDRLPDLVVMGADIYLVDSLGCISGLSVSHENGNTLLLERGNLSKMLISHESLHMAHYYLLDTNENYTGNIMSSVEHELLAYTMSEFHFQLSLGLYHKTGLML